MSLLCISFKPQKYNGYFTDVLIKSYILLI